MGWAAATAAVLNAVTAIAPLRAAVTEDGSIASVRVTASSIWRNLESRRWRSGTTVAVGWAAASSAMLSAVATVTVLGAALSEGRSLASVQVSAGSVWRNWLLWCWWWLRWATAVWCGSTTVPAGLWVVHASTNGNSSVAVLLDLLEHVFSQAVDGLVMVVVGENVEAVLADNLSSQEGVKDSLGVTNELWAIVLPILSIEIGLDDVVAERAETVLASRAARQEWWTDVLWENTHDVVHGHLVPVNLILEGGEVAVEKTQVRMAISVGCNLMARSVHALDQLRISSSAIVHAINAIVEAINEESCLCSITVEQIKEVLGPLCWSIIKSQCNDSLLSASVDWSSVWNWSGLASPNESSVRSWWSSSLALLNFDRLEGCKRVTRLQVWVDCEVTITLGHMSMSEEWANQSQELESLELHCSCRAEVKLYE